MKAGMGYVSAVRNESSIAGADGSVPRDVLACDVRPASRSIQWSVRGLRLLWLHVQCGRFSSSLALAVCCECVC